MKHFHLIILLVGYCAVVSGMDADNGKVRECIGKGLYPTIADNQYTKILMQMTITPVQDRDLLWNREYGEDTLSAYLMQNKSYERRLFKLQFFKSPAEVANSIFSNPAVANHLCNLSDIQNFQIEYTDETNGVVAGTVTIERLGIYRVECCFVAQKHLTNDWRLEFLGVLNHLSNEIRYARPVYERTHRWIEFECQLHALGMPPDWSVSSKGR